MTWWSQSVHYCAAPYKLHTGDTIEVLLTSQDSLLICSRVGRQLHPSHRVQRLWQQALKLIIIEEPASRSISLGPVRHRAVLFCALNHNTCSPGGNSIMCNNEYGARDFV